MALATSPSGSDSAALDGPVLNLMNKRLRALRKKYNRIIQMEASLAQGKTLNKEQEEVLRSKSGVVTLIDEYEKLRSPLLTAVQEELARASSFSSSRNDGPALELADEPSSLPDSSLEDLLALLYFGCLFDVKPQSDFASTMLTRAHERGCCLTYDYVTDDATELLGEKDLDMISALGGLVTSRPLYSGISHMSALQGCLQRAKLWLQAAHQPIVDGSSVTYAILREKLNKIMASDYYTTTPEMKAPVDVAAAGGKYNASCQVQVSESGEEPAPDASSDDLPTHYEEQEEDEEEEDLHSIEASIAVTASEQLATTHDLLKDEDEADPSSGEMGVPQNEQRSASEDAGEHGNDLSSRDYEARDHQHPFRRPYQSARGGGPRGRSQRGYYAGPRGRNGRGGGYENGRNQYYYDQGYNTRNYYNPRGRGGGSGSGGRGVQNYHGGAPGGAGPSNVELGASA